MSANLRMNSANSFNINHTITPVSNMSFDKTVAFCNSVFISSKTMDECASLEKEDINANDKIFDCLPPISSIKKEEKDDDSINTIEEKTYNGIYYADAMDMEAAMMEDIKWRKFCEENSKLQDKILKDTIGDGNMEYIKNLKTREIYTNAWKAITFSNNWDFVAQNIDSFIWSNDPRIDKISEKMSEFGYDGHSGNSFGDTMRNMQYLVQNGEEKFKKIFHENSEKAITKFLEYGSGF